MTYSLSASGDVAPAKEALKAQATSWVEKGYMREGQVDLFLGLLDALGTPNVSISVSGHNYSAGGGSCSISLSGSVLVASA